jgi:quercetin dioxygenase-like cupin family protein
MVTYGSDNGYRQAATGVERKTLVHGAATMMVQFRLEEGSRLPRHSHENEQTGYLIVGSLRFTIGEEIYTLAAGDSWCIPGGVAHSVEALHDSVVVEGFSPPREDFLP